MPDWSESWRLATRMQRLRTDKNSKQTMKIEKNKVIELSYELEVDGAIVDRAVEERPLDYIQGMNMLLPKFEEYLEGKEPGESFAFTLTPAEGYGYSEPAMVLSLPKTAFMLDGKMHDELLVIGKTLPMINQMGNVVNGTVKEILEDSVKMVGLRGVRNLVYAIGSLQNLTPDTKNKKFLK